MSYKNTFYIIKNRRFDLPYHFIDIKDLRDEEKIFDCSICLESYSNKKGLDLVRLDSCNHMFHEKCIRECLKFSRVCPLCRVNVDDDTKCGCIIS